MTMLESKPMWTTSWLARIVWPWLLAGIACVLSMTRTGYNFNVGNNAFHVPIVLRFEELPQFADDPFVLSLRHFVSPVYLLLSWIATEGNIESLFLIGLVSTHFLTFFALLRIGQACGIKDWREQAVLVFLLIAARGLYWGSPVGADSMLSQGFSHTELARAVALFAIAELLRGRLIWTGALTGLAFALNAFVGIWTLAPVAAKTVWYLAMPGRSAGGTARLKIVLLAIAAFAVPAMPIAAWIAHVSMGTIVDFNYRAFLESYYPYHFFLHAAGWWSVTQVVCTVLAGFLAAGLLKHGRETRLVLASLASVFGVGVLVGMFSEARLVLNLHLLRVDGMLVLFSAALVAAVAALQMRQKRPIALAIAAGAGFGLFSGIWPIAAAAMLLGYAPRIWLFLNEPSRLAMWAAWPVVRPAAFVAVAFILAVAGSAYARNLRLTPMAGVPSDYELSGGYPLTREWLDIKRWVRRNTPIQAMFLVPSGLDDGFRTEAQRRIWVGGKDGATAMWAPQTFHTWKQRREEVRFLDGLDVSLAYACAHGINYVVLDLRREQNKQADPKRAVFANGWFEVHAARCVGGSG